MHQLSIITNQILNKGLKIIKSKDNALQKFTGLIISECKCLYIQIVCVNEMLYISCGKTSSASLLPLVCCSIASNFFCFYHRGLNIKLKTRKKNIFLKSMPN